MERENVDEGSQVNVACRRCKTPQHFSPVRLVRFPADARAVLDLVAGRLNATRCRVCGLEMLLDVAMIVSHRKAEAVATIGFKDSDLEDLRAASARFGDDVDLLPQPDREALRAVVAGWLEAYLGRALALLQGDSRPAPNEDGVRPHQEPLVLLWLQRASASDFPLLLLTDPPLDEQEHKKLNRGLLTEFTVKLVDGLFTHAFHHGGIVTVLDLVERHVPTECLDEEVLGSLLERCIDFDPELQQDPHRFDRAFRFEYLCAVAHAAAGRFSRRGGHWAGLSLLLFSWSRTEAVEVPEMMLLEAPVLRRLVAFDDAWNIAAPLFNEALDEAEAWFDHIGWGERFRQEWAAVPMQIPPEDLADMEVGEFIARLRKLASEQGEEYADTLPIMVATLYLRAGRRDDAVGALLAAQDALAEEGEWKRLGQMAISGASLMNQHLDYEASDRVLNRHLDPLLEEDIGCQLRYSIVNEIGNAFRHQGFAAAGLETYDLAAELMDGCEQAAERDRCVLRRNRAIVLRELGSFEEAIAELEATLRESDPEDLDERIGLLVSLARTYVDANLPEQALPYAEEATRIPLTTSRAPQRIEILLGLAAARAASEPGAEIPELTEALALAEFLPRLQTVVAAAILYHAQRGSVLEERAISKAHAVLEDRWRNPDPVYPPSALVTAGFCLAEWELDQGRGERAREIVANLREVFEARLPWMVTYLQARLVGTEVGESWALMKVVLQALDGSVPDQSGVGFAIPYLVDKADVQRFLLLTLRSALEAGIAGPADCINVFEFLNGREMRGSPTADRAEPFDRLKGAAAGLSVLFLFLLEYQQEVQIVWVRPDGECGLMPLGLEAPELRRIAAEFDVRVGTCLTTSQMEAVDDLLEPMLTALGEAIEGRAAPGEHVCILPSPALLGLPLHAARRADGVLLLEHHSISLAPNLSVVCRALEGERDGAAGSCLIAAVCKQGDREEFVSRAETAARGIEEALGEASITSIRGVEADKAAVLDGIERHDHFVFIGHGARAARAHGRGICVAADGNLPSAPLPVDDVPELRRFMIDAGDLEGLARTPAMVSSVACSSGRSFVGEGGVRLGLERALFVGGTRTILAPQWDVNGPAALRFLRVFYETLGGDSAVSIAEAHRRTCLVLEEECRHLFLWAPFALNGSWQ